MPLIGARIFAEAATVTSGAVPDWEAEEHILLLGGVAPLALR